MFASLGRVVVRWRYLVVAAWIVLTGVSAVLALQAPERLVPGGFSSPNLESQRAYERFAQQIGGPSPTLLVVISDPSGPIADAAGAGEIERLRRKILSVEGVTGVDRPADVPMQISESGQAVYLNVHTIAEADGTEMADGVDAAVADSHLNVRLAGVDTYVRDIQEHTKRDLQRAELVGIPFVLGALLLVFGTLTAAAVPLLVGAVSVVAGLAALWVIAGLVDISIFALNIASLIGLGLGVDYSLFLVSRFRRELQHAPAARAVELTMASMGKTIAFSATAVIIGLASLTIFEFQFFRSIGIGGTLVCVVVALCTLTLVPAVLAILGERINWLRVLPAPREHSLFWERIARTVMARPLIIFLPTASLLMLFLIPLSQSRISLPDARVLPPESQSRQAFELLEREFGAGETAPLFLVMEFEHGPFATAALAQQFELARALEADPRVDRTSSIVSLDPRISLSEYELLYREQAAIADLLARSVQAKLTSGRYSMMVIVPSVSATSAESNGLVLAIRDWVRERGIDGLLGGQAAGSVDFNESVYQTFPRAVGTILAVTLVLLAIMFRSLLLPLKAVMLNLLSLSASFGAVVVIFQFGWFAPVLGFEPLGYVDATLPVILFAVLFGLSMDYEVFLLARVQEAWFETADNELAVARGMQASGRVITSAAAVVVVVGLAFATADIVVVKALGLAAAVAIAIDASLVRCLLAPAAMKLAGRWNWWLPGRGAGGIKFAGP